MPGIQFGSNNGGITLAGGDAGAITAEGNGGGVTLSDATTTSGGGLSSYQRAVIAGYVGTEAEFYAQMAKPITAEWVEDQLAADNVQDLQNTEVGDLALFFDSI